MGQASKRGPREIRVQQAEAALALLSPDEQRRAARLRLSKSVRRRQEQAEGMALALKLTAELLGLPAGEDR